MDVRWEVAVPIPRKTPPYERTRHGSVRQRVTAKVTFSGLLSRALTVDKVRIDGRSVERC